MTAAVLDLLASFPGSATVLPIVDGEDQPLLRWSLNDLDATAAAVAGGERSLRRLPERSAAVLLGEADWHATADREAFADVDTPEDLAALGLGGRFELPGRQ